MADNTQLNAGTGGDVIASDDIGGVKYQRVKATFGKDGEAVDVSADVQAQAQGGLLLDKRLTADFAALALAGFELRKVCTLSSQAAVTSEASADLVVLPWTISVYQAYAVPAVAIAYVPIENYVAKVPAQVYQASVPVDESTATV